MRKVVSIVVLLLAYSHAMTLANDGKGDIRRLKAKSFLENRLQRTIADRQLKELTLASPLIAERVKVFEVDGGGFALLQNKEGQPVVIGYSDRGNFSEENMPEPMRQWLENYPAQEELSATDASSAPRAPFHFDYTPVAPLLTSAWGQNEPFNHMCPTYNGENTKAGCTTVALAQVLYYYQSANTSQVVEEYVDPYTKAEISVDFSKGGYDWANMLPVYEEGHYTELQEQAVARLIYEASVACHCEYKDYYTTGCMPFVALQQHYDFNCNYYYRPFVSTEMWMSTLQRNLLEGRPIIYAGGNHAYVVDGIDADGLCHVNWGWAGLDDGYYDITFSRPPSYTGSGFLTDQRMIVDICPRSAGEAYEEKLVQVGMMVANPIKNENYSTYNCSFTAVTTNYYHTIDDNVGHGFIKAGEPMNPETNPILLADWIGTYYSSTYYHINGSKITVRVSNGAVVGGSGNGKVDIPDGTYEVRLVSGDEYDPSTWKVAEWPSEYMATVEVRDGQYYVSDEMVNKDELLYVHDFQTISDVYAGSYFYVMLDMEHDKDFRGRNSPTFPNLPFANLETGNVYIQQGSGVNTKLPTYYPGVKAKCAYRVRPVNPENGFGMPMGSYKFDFESPTNNSIKWENATGEDIVIDVADKPTYPILDVPTSASDIYGIFGASESADIKVLAKDAYQQNDKPKFYSSQLYSANLIGGNVVINLYARPEGGGDEVFICSLPDYPINANSISNTSRDLPVKLFPLKGAYRFSFRYLTPDGERTLLNPLTLGHRVFIYSSSNNVQLEATSLLMATDDHVEAGQETPLSITIRNRDSRNFSGNLKATFINRETGDFVQAESTEFTVASAQEESVSFKVMFANEGSYDVYLDGVETGSDLGTAVLGSSLTQRACMSLSVGTVGISSPVSKSVKQPVAYDLQGRRMSTSHLPKGIYLINGKKTVIR